MPRGASPARVATDSVLEGVASRWGRGRGRSPGPVRRVRSTNEPAVGVAVTDVTDVGGLSGDRIATAKRGVGPRGIVDLVTHYGRQLLVVKDERAAAATVAWRETVRKFNKPDGLGTCQRVSLVLAASLLLSMLAALLSVGAANLLCERDVGQMSGSSLCDTARIAGANMMSVVDVTVWREAVAEMLRLVMWPCVQIFNAVRATN